MTSEMYLYYHTDQDRYVGFTDREDANRYGKAFSNLKGYVVTVDPPVPTVYRVRFHIYYDCIQIEVMKSSPIEKESMGQMRVYSHGAVGVFVSASSPDDAIAVAQAILMEKLSTAKKVVMK